MDRKYRLTLDPQVFDRKPQGKEIGAITRRMQTAGPAEVTADELARAIVRGVTWAGGCFEPCATGWGPFVSMQVFALDFDNDTEMLDEDGRPLRDEAGHCVKRPLMPGESGYLDPWDALDKFRESFGTWPLMMHPSMGLCFDGTERGRFDPETRMKYRLVYAFDAPITDKARASDAIAIVLKAFPEADQKCVNVNRLFFGARGRAVWYEESGRPHYVVA